MSRRTEASRRLREPSRFRRTASARDRGAPARSPDFPAVIGRAGALAAAATLLVVAWPGPSSRAAPPPAGPAAPASPASAAAQAAAVETVTLAVEGMT